MQYAEKHAKCENFFSNLIVGVDPRYIKSGVASGLNAMCLQYARAHDMRHLMATCTYDLPAILACSCGYREHTRVPYERITNTGGDISGVSSIMSSPSATAAAASGDLLITVVIILLVRRLVVVSSRVGSYLIASSA